MDAKTSLLGAALALALPAGAAVHKPRELGVYSGVPALGVRVIYRASAATIGVWRLPDGEQVASYARPRPAAGYRAAAFEPAAKPHGDKRLLAWTFDESVSSRPFTTTFLRLHLFEAPGDEPGRVLLGLRVPGAWESVRNAVQGDVSESDRFALLRIKASTGSFDAFVLHRYRVDLESAQVEHSSAAYPGSPSGFSTVYRAEDVMPHSDDYFVKPDDEGRLLALEYEDDSAVSLDVATGRRIAILQRYAKDSMLGTWLYGARYASVSRSAPGGDIIMVWDTFSGARIGERFLATEVQHRYLGVQASKAAFLERFSSDTIRVWDLASDAAPAIIPALEEVDSTSGRGRIPGSGVDAELSADGSYLVYRSSGRYRVAELDPPIPLAYTPGEAVAPAGEVVDVDTPPPARTPRDPDAFAVVVGVSKYRIDGIPAVDDAARDARAVYATLTKSMGYDPKNVLLLLDGQAGRADLDKSLGPWLRNRVGERSRVFVYFSGHGAPNPTSGEGYLMPYDGDPNYLAETAYPLARLYEELGRLPTREATVVLDSCFSGRGDRSLLAAGARPLVNIKPQAAAGNTSVIAASAATQISLSHRRARHGLLTYYLLEGLRGPADADRDGKVTAGEAFAYARPAVERAARLQNAEQTPVASPSVERLAAGSPWVLLKR